MRSASDESEESPSRAKRTPAGAAVLREDVTEAIRAAVFAELAEGGYGRMSIERVARRAGVGKTAVYRRWGSKLEMVIDMVSAVAVDITELPDTGSLHGDIETVLMIAAHALRHPLAAHIVPDLLAEAARNPAIATILHEALSDNQRGIGTLLIERARRRGELTSPVDPDFFVDLIVGPLYWRLAVARAPLTANYLGQLAAAATTAVTAAPST
ncbi:TetR family transcriptional regulator [Actinocatenispora thailandica]|uniref:TetR family transcriptional regulator n=1 Tax=Actinocatenispora thailandica TaxID=227318 RepID=A0A7R7DMB7_9ACTN|nr:TetR/AcrR family transcriptional regulator [Actinocatenispora thailandica]BCJ34227.1 TetR family transcriptional regulator [Actinocatenispora thailandica]